MVNPSNIIIKPSFKRKAKLINVTAMDGNKFVNTIGIIIKIAGNSIIEQLFSKTLWNIKVYLFK